MRKLFSLVILIVFYGSSMAQLIDDNTCEQLGFETDQNFFPWQGETTILDPDNSSYGLYQYDVTNWEGIELPLYDVANVDYPSEVKYSERGVNNVKFKIINDPDGEDSKVTAIKFKSPNGSGSIIRLGNNRVSYFSEKLSYTFKVTEENKYFTYSYALVLDDAKGHKGRPYFYADVRDQDNQIVPCSDIKYTADQTIYTDLIESGSVFYKDWTNQTVDLSSHIDEEVTVNFITSDCDQGGHYGYAYLDLSCSNLSIEILEDELCTETAMKFQSNSTGVFKNESYEWDFGDESVSDQDILASPTHNYSEPGKYDVTLTISYETTSECTSRVIKRDDVEVKDETCPEFEFDLGVSCLDHNSNFNVSGLDEGSSISWSFGDGGDGTNEVSHTYSDIGYYDVSATVTGICGCLDTLVDQIEIIECVNCEECIPSFKPEPGERYILSAWVKEDVVGASTYKDAAIILDFENAPDFGPILAQGSIIDGWQRIEYAFTVDDNATAINVRLKNLGVNDVFFDDIRIHPFNSNMKSFVYDPLTLRLHSELDENNYATYYEYDEEGALVRVKKETQRGVKTINETRQSLSKQK